MIIYLLCYLIGVILGWYLGGKSKEGECIRLLEQAEQERLRADRAVDALLAKVGSPAISQEAVDEIKQVEEQFEKERAGFEMLSKETGGEGLPKE
jgi:hypothetical protein